MSKRIRAVHAPRQRFDVGAQRDVARLLAAAAAARRQLGEQITEAQAALAHVEADHAGVQAEVAALEARAQELAVAAAAARQHLGQAEAALPGLADTAQATAALAHQRTTPVGHPPARGRSAADQAAAAAGALVDAVGRRDHALQAVAGAEHDLERAQASLVEARSRVAALGEQLAQRANALDGLRRQQAAAPHGGAEVGWGARSLTASGGQEPSPSAMALADVPADYLELYRAHARSCPGLSWTVLAAIGSLESAHGRASAPGVSQGANAAGAMGPMQFLAPTWAAHGIDGDGDGSRDVYQPADAVAGAANYLCANGAGQLARLAGAVWAYNHADWYVASVIQLAMAYGGGGLGNVAVAASAAEVVDHPNLTLSAQARADLLAGDVDHRVVQALGAAVAAHRVTVGVIRTGHGQLVAGTERVSHHFVGRGIDITEVDGAPVEAANDAALELSLALLTAEAPLRPEEFGSPWPQLARFPGGFADDDHTHHLHVAWTAE